MKPKVKRNRYHRALQVEALESRQLLAGDILPPVVSNNSDNFAKAADYSAKSDGVSLVIVLDGQIVYEDYPTDYSATASAGTAWELFIAAKSFWGPVAVQRR